MVVAGVLSRKFWNGRLARRTENQAHRLMRIFVARVFIEDESHAPRNLLRLRRHRGQLGVHRWPTHRSKLHRRRIRRRRLQELSNDRSDRQLEWCGLRCRTVSKNEAGDEWASNPCLELSPGANLVRNPERNHGWNADPSPDQNRDRNRKLIDRLSVTSDQRLQSDRNRVTIHHHLDQSHRATIRHPAVIRHRATIRRRATIRHRAVIHRRATIRHRAVIHHRAMIRHRAVIHHRAMIRRRATIRSRAAIRHRAVIHHRVTIRRRAVNHRDPILVLVVRIIYEEGSIRNRGSFLTCPSILPSVSPICDAPIRS